MGLDGVVPYPPEFAERYRRLGYWRDETLDTVFGELFARHHDRVALQSGDQTITYAELGQRSASMAGYLYRRGLRPLDRVVVHLPNGPEFLFLYFALQKIGVVPILALAPHRRLEIDHFVKLADAVAYFGSDRGAGRRGAQRQRSAPRRLHARRAEGHTANRSPTPHRRGSDRSLRLAAVRRNDRHSKTDTANA